MKSRKAQGSPCTNEVLSCGSLLVLFALFCLLAGSLPARAQAVYGSIFGTVTDNTGAVVPNATITVTDISKGTSVVVQTNDSGSYKKRRSFGAGCLAAIASRF